MAIFTLPDRGVLRVSGEEAEPFLQNLVSNDVSQADETRAVYATLLTPQGKFLHDFFVYRDPKAGDGFLMEMPADRLPDLQKRLTMYRLRARVDLQDVSDSYVSAAILGDVAPADGIWRPDPRHPEMGLRGLVAATATLPAATDIAEYEKHRISLGIPSAGADLVPERNFLLEFRMDDLNAIDFSKGCYVGQELTARTKYRGNVKRQHFVATFPGDAPPNGTPVLNADGVEVGTVLSGSGNSALVTIRLDQWEKELDAGTGPVQLLPPSFASTDGS